MVIIKKLDWYVLKKFLLVFAGAFFVVLFVFMMQFTWRYVDDLIGKGLSFDILAKFYWYMAQTLVRDSLPLSVLLASLITFGNMGESFELLAMKAAGIPLIRIMRPLAIFAAFLTGTSFYFQNFTSPDAQINMRTLLFSMKEQSPAVEIPEGVFYNGVPNINIYVQRKNTLTGMLYQTIIYKTDQGFDRAQIVLADSARLEVTRDKMHLRLELWNGEQFESLESSGGAATQMMQNGAHEPFDRETFRFKTLLIDFDSNFNLMDKSLIAGMPTAKNMKQIQQSVDSMNAELDSVGRQYYKDACVTYYRRPQLPAKDSVALLNLLRSRQGQSTLAFDTIVAHADPQKLQMARQIALSSVKSVSADLEWKAMGADQEQRSLLGHEVEWHNKITYSLACLLFFFVGAPLGAIIRKGGLGMPTVISVAIFIVWYIIYTSGMKMARDGNINMVLGMWISTMVIAPFSVFFTYKANKDSVVFNIDAYKHFFVRLFGLRTSRHIFRKEVIIDEPRLDKLPVEIEALISACKAYNEKSKLLRAPSYVNIFFHHVPDRVAEQIDEQMERIVEELSNSRNRVVLEVLNRYPILYTHAHTSPFDKKWANVAAGLFVPLGIVLWFRIWRFRLRLYRDMRVIVRTSEQLLALLQGNTLVEGGDAVANGAAVSPSGGIILRWASNRRVVITLLAAVLLVVAGYGGWHAWRRYQYKRYMQEHGELTPNTPKQPDGGVAPGQLPLGNGAPLPLRLPQQAP
ncbi:LptF/LptG family permease [uncultured Prevotellamassilia sp.]|uniref:LptF/LptG family permease n=1 Tax=uncultured Prevotellamassilia sp. TaxID=1926676 RepID=UPI0025865108|nr:LptF/LptG family permease [uncultured Prevotellamassilia sp.]